jgi:O-antigen/teichoic acid export membrane protein
MRSSGLLLRNAAALLASQGITKVLNIAVSVAVVRWLGARDLGRYSYIVAFCYPFGALADFGLSTLTIREISRHRPQEAALLTALSRHLLALGALSVVAMLVAALLSRHEHWALVGIGLVGCGTILSTLTTPSLVLLTAREQLQQLALFRTAAALVGSLLTVVALVTGGGVPGLFGAALATNAIMWFLARALAGKPTAYPFPTSETSTWLWKPAVPFGLLMVAYAVYYRLDMIMLEWLRGSSELGQYAAAYRFYDGTMLVAASLGGPFFPRLARLVPDAPEEARSLLESTWRPLLALGLPISIGIYLLADSLIALLFGVQFSPAAAPLRVLALAVLPILWVNLLSHALNAANRVWALASVYAISILLNGAANLVLIPWGGAFGASLATLACDWLVLFLVVRLVRRHLRLTFSADGLWRYALAAAGLVVSLTLTRDAGLTLAALTGGLTYGAVLMLLGFRQSADMDALKRLWGQ